MRYSTVIFDMDGTLLDTLDDLMNSVNIALVQFGFPKRTRTEIRAFVGNGVGMLVKRSVPEGTDEKTEAECLKVFKAHYAEHSAVYTKPYDGITELLRLLKEQGVGIAVVSNKFDLALKELCDRFFPGLVDYSAGEKAGVPKKPAPDSVFDCMNALGADKNTTLYVGDSEVDMATAANASLPAAGVLWGFRDRGVLTEGGAAYIINDPHEIAAIVKGE